MLQLDLFAPPPPPPVIAATKRTRRADVDQFECDLSAAHAATDRAKAAGTIERLAWGEATKGSYVRFGKPAYLLQFYQDGGIWYAREELSLFNSSSSSGPFWPVEDRIGQTEINTREAVILFHIRRLLRNAATAMARPHGDGETRAKQYAKLAEWAIAQCPALIYGIDMAAEFASLREAADAREDRRCTAFHAAYDLAERAKAVLSSIDVDAYSGSTTTGLIHNKSIKNWPGKGEDAEGHARAFPAEWAISGHAPAALSITFYPRTGQTDAPTVRAAIDALTIALSEPILIAEEDAPYPHGNWTWEDK